jgi:hypothetical protein
MRESEDPFRVITDLLMPNYSDFLRKLDGSVQLTAVATAAVALRLEALESGGYPPIPEDASDALAAVLAEAFSTVGPEGEGLEYETLAGEGVGARLRVTSEGVLGHLPDSRRAELEPLLVWELPPPSPPPAWEE